MRSPDAQSTYPDVHPLLRDHLVTLTLPGEDQPRQYMPRDEFEKVATHRDDLRRTLALISAWRLDSGTRDPALDRLLASVGESYTQARATASVIAGVRQWAAEQTATKPVVETTTGETP